MITRSILRQKKEPGRRRLYLPKGWSKWSKVVVLSPHSDDVAFSLAGHMHYLSRSVKESSLITCFSRSAFTQHAANGDVESTTELRKREDAQYAAECGPLCTPYWLDLPDAPLRGYPLGDVRHAREFSAEELHLVRHITYGLMDAFIEPGFTIFAPLGIGSHIDHRIVHAAAIALAKSCMFNMIFYEDMPYATGCEDDAINDLVSQLQDKLAGGLMMSLCNPRKLPAVKQSAACHYPSQVRPETLARVFNGGIPHARYMCERVWQFRPQHPFALQESS